MCVVGCKYFKGHGWVGIKNRDRNYIPEISFRRRTQDGVETMLFWDDITKYCEGLNSGGVSILSASLMVLDDEKEITTRASKPSKDGEKIARALRLPNVVDAAKSLIKDKLPGNTIIFDRKNCYLLEGAWEPGGYSTKAYKYHIKEIPKDKTAVRTNHGVWLPWAGYQRNDENDAETLSRISSESRLAQAQALVDAAKSPNEMIDGLAGTYVNNPQLNVLRTAAKRKMMRTTSQIMLWPEEYTMFVRPVQSHITFNFWDLNDPEHKLWSEILSNRVLYAHKEHGGDIPIPQMNHSA